MTVVNTQALAKRKPTRSFESSRRNARDDAFNDFLLALDPPGDSENSKSVRFALATSPDRRFREFLKRLFQPRYQRWSLGAIAKSCDLSFGEFFEFWQRAQVERAIASMCHAAPSVAQGLVEAALPREVACERCEGLGSIPVEAWIPPELVLGYLGRLSDDPAAPPARTCPFCNGAGKVVKPGDIPAAKTVLEIASLTGKGRPAVAIVQNFSGTSHAGGMRELASMKIDISDEPADEE